MVNPDAHGYKTRNHRKIAIAKPQKLLGDPKSCRPISLPIQGPRVTHLLSCRTNRRPIAPAGAGGLSTREIDRRSGHLAYTAHRG